MNLADRTINPLLIRRAVYQQGETASPTYTIDYAAMLNGDAITGSVWYYCNGSLTLVASYTDTTASVQISGPPGRYLITNTVATASGEVEARQLSLTIGSKGPLGDYE